MKITLYGAAHEVTGSCYLVETASNRFLVDCGMFQGSEKAERRNRIPNRINAKNLEAVLLTHGHLDHCGRLPLLMKAGFKGPIYATAGTIEIAKLILLDAAGIQEGDTKRENRKRARAGMQPLEPLFKLKDVQRVIEHFRIVEYNQPFKLRSDLTVNYVDAGHILGSACIEVVTTEDGKPFKTVFSGDLGQYGVPLMRDPEVIRQADAVIMESTYGDRDHRTLDDTVKEFQDIVIRAVENRSKILIPSFAVGRTQTILYHLAEMFRKGLVTPIPVYLDSPMAISASRTYLQFANIMDSEITDLISSGQLRNDLATLVTCESAEQSQALNTVNGPCIIIAGAGMCNAGRIMHHLRHNLWHDDCNVIIVGYQAHGSLGRALVEGMPKVKVMGETVSVRATISSLGGFSAHAGQSDLLRWLEPMTNDGPQIVLTHGESHQSQELASAIRRKFGMDSIIPGLTDTIDLARKYEVKQDQLPVNSSTN
ncbi:MAG: MBL fold metallo-hydrolase [Candidatus Melainabacteria bacterium]|mgnify:CR=1 FL=1|nr:MBL fold metallo-hydrolase [Candidatus Melainabacteria bacterium]